MRTFLSRGLLLGFGIVLALAFVEAVLQIGSLFADVTGHHSLVSRLADRRAWLALGDSNTYGLYVEREESFPSVLERLWLEDPGLPQIQMINLGFPGTNSTTVRNQLPALLERLKPERVLVLVGVNDIWTIHEPSAERPRTDQGLERLLWRWSRLFRLFFMLRRNVEMPELGDEYTPESPLGFEQRRVDVEIAGESVELGFTPRESGADEDWPRLLSNNLSAIAEMTTAAGVGLSVLTYASGERHYGRTNAVLRAWARESGSSLIDPTPAFSQRCPRGRCDLLLADRHPSASGHALFARIVFDALSPTHAATSP